MQLARIKQACILSPKIDKKQYDGGQQKGDNIIHIDKILVNSVDRDMFKNKMIQQYKQNQTLCSNINELTDLNNHKQVKQKPKLNKLSQKILQTDKLLLQIKQSTTTTNVKTLPTLITLPSTTQLLQQLNQQTLNQQQIQNHLLSQQQTLQTVNHQPLQHQQYLNTNSNGCLQCQLTLIQTKTLINNKQILLQQQYWQQKQQMKKSYDQKYNQLSIKLSQQQILISQIKVQNQYLQSIVQNIEIQMIDKQHYYNKIIDNNIKQYQQQLKQLTQHNEQTIQSLNNKYQQQLQSLQQQLQYIKQQLIQSQQQSQQIQQRYKQRLEQSIDEHQLTVNNIKKHYQSKYKLIQQRLQSQIQTIYKQREIQREQDEYIIKGYKQSIQSKDSLIQDMFKTIQSIQQYDYHSDQAIERQTVSSIPQIKPNNISQLSKQIKQQYQSKFNKYINHMQDKQKLLKQKYQDKVNHLQRINSMYLERLLQNKKNINRINYINRINQISSNTYTYSHINQPLVDIVDHNIYVIDTDYNNSFLQNQQNINLQNSHSLQLKQSQIYQHRINCLQNQLKTKQSQLALYQQLVQTQQQKHQQQLSILNHQKQHMYSKQIQCLKDKLNLSQLLIHQMKVGYQLKIKQKQKEIQCWRHKCQQIQNEYKKQPQEQNYQEYEKINKQLQLSTEQIIRLKQSITQLKQTITQLKQTITQLKQTITQLKQQIPQLQQQIIYQQQQTIASQQLKQTISLQHKIQQQKNTLNQLISTITKQYQQQIQKIKNSYQKIIIQKSQQIKQHSQIISTLIQVNFQLNVKNKSFQRNLIKLQTQFKQLIAFKLSNQMEQHSSNLQNQ